ncbi:uncharacterized protein LOC109715362 [Ananas comosus]|uniref:Uncharacterized protein LOC109715362 n=1 Tax=Ananas comosus TaxID=4615 RepID=A0A6P5FJ27_ANACO|nr:uncharacterized protein LOC109715362 [Ananas comosus]
MEVHENRFAVLCDLDGDNNDLSSLLAKKAAAKPEAATGKQKQQKKKNPKAAAVASTASAASGFPSRPVPPSQHAKNFQTASARPTEHGRGTGSNNDHWINSKKKNQSTGGRSNTGFLAYGKEETGTSATNSGSSTSGVHNRSTGDFPGNKTIEQANDDDNKLTFAEYKKSIQEKRKAIEALKTEERKVTVENQFEGMHLTGKKKEDDLQVNMQKSGKNKDKKDGFEKEKIVCKTVSIGKFQIPAKEEAARRGRRNGHRGGNCAGGHGCHAAVPRTHQDGVDFPPLRPAADAAANF